jgi:hypothetical protein
MFALFHEPNNYSTFWWANKPAAEYISMWRYVHDYLVGERGLSNIIFVYAVNGSAPSPGPATYYPGDAYVDIVGIDYYSTDGRVDGTDGVSSTALSHYNALKALGKPFALTELGQCLAPDGGYSGRTDENCSGRDARHIVDDMSTYFPEAVFWCNWDDEDKHYGLGNQLHVPQLMSDPRVVTLRDKPNRKAAAEVVPAR